MVLRTLENRKYGGLKTIKEKRNKEQLDENRQRIKDVMEKAKRAKKLDGGEHSALSTAKVNISHEKTVLELLQQKERQIQEEIAQNFKPKEEENNDRQIQKSSRYKSQNVLTDLYEQEDDKDTIKYDYSPIHSDDSAHARQVKKLAIQKNQDRMEKFVNFAKFRDQMCKEPALDTNKLSDKQKALLKSKDYDGFYAESIDIDEDMFKKLQDVTGEDKDKHKREEMIN